MSIKFERPIVPAIGLTMLSGRTRLLGIPKEKVQVVMTLPNINEFNEALNEAIEFFKDRADAFIITSSSHEMCEDIVSQYNLSENLISNEFKDFGKTFNMIDESKQLKKSLMIIDTNCQITHKDIL